MSLQLLVQTFIYGNLDLCFTNRLKRNFLCSREEILTILDRDFPEGDESSPWRFMNNLIFLVDSCESWIISEKENFSHIIDFMDKFIDICVRKMKITDFKITSRPSRTEDFMILNFKILLNKVYSKLILYKISDVTVKVDPFIVRFSNFLDDDGIYYDNVTPYDEIKWSSKWKLIFQNNEMIIEDVDVFLDSYFKNHNFYYNKTMFGNIRKMSSRLKYLKRRAPNYYSILVSNIRDVSKTFYETFPFRVVFRDYRELLSVDSRVYKKGNQIASDQKLWMLSILPKFLSSYILGFPVVSFDIPSERTLEKHIEMLSKMGEGEYFKFISESSNGPNIKSM